MQDHIFSSTYTQVLPGLVDGTAVQDNQKES